MNDKKIMEKHFIENIAKTIFDYNMIDQKDKILAAVSGGPDSVALVLSLLALKERYTIKIGIAHLNHLLRGEESLRDEAFVKKLADTLALPFHEGQKDVKAYAEKHRLSIEEAGREVRYDFFQQIAESHGYNKIALGHTKDDNAELVLMNLLRGAGPKGLSGIPPIRDSRYIRPLIRVSKTKILAFLKLKKQAYVFDSSNKDMKYLRNNIRYKLIPHLQSEYNPEIIEALDRLSNILKQEEDFWDAETKIQFNNCLIKTKDTSIVFSKTLLSNLHPALLNRVLREAIKKIKKDLKRISLTHLIDIVEFCFNKPSGISLDLPGQIRVYKKKDTIIIKKENKPLREIGKKEKQSRQMAQKK
ncbi:MAG: tRNA lysidine(34) synthetase TilS [Desulfobacula sp.]|uniref:tRNA lysidine(34) synthetase TilS n=1 Tax=Desulfobacula sp. TaxID=2593537 RepID=UPI0025C08681|nr:tRNA lysidine(34) synthetase TilS [Desulfobacula sp.]MCD4721863.1 tRNA lysidine(34) synthetase TilS [Desulfobacula sp.]